MLQTEMLHLYSQMPPDAHSRPVDVCSRPNSGSIVLPVAEGSYKPHPSSSSVSIINGGVRAFSTSPLHFPSCSSPPHSHSPIDSPLAIGSFLEQRAQQLFRLTNHTQEEEEEKQEEEEEEEKEVQPESLSLGHEVEEALLLTGSPESEPPSRAAAPSVPASEPAAPCADLTLAVRQRRQELGIMDYNETLPEY